MREMLEIAHQRGLGVQAVVADSLEKVRGQLPAKAGALATAASDFVSGMGTVPAASDLLKVSESETSPQDIAVIDALAGHDIRELTVGEKELLGDVIQHGMHQQAYEGKTIMADGPVFANGPPDNPYSLRDAMLRDLQATAGDNKDHFSRYRETVTNALREMQRYSSIVQTVVNPGTDGYNVLQRQTQEGVRTETEVIRDSWEVFTNALTDANVDANALGKELKRDSGATIGGHKLTVGHLLALRRHMYVPENRRNILSKGIVVSERPNSQPVLLTEAEIDSLLALVDEHGERVSGAPVDALFDHLYGHQNRVFRIINGYHMRYLHSHYPMRTVRTEADSNYQEQRQPQGREAFKTMRHEHYSPFLGILSSLVDEG